MNIFARARRFIAAQFPGGALNIARRKREYERELLDQGFSRTEARRMAAKHFRRISH